MGWNFDTKVGGIETQTHAFSLITFAKYDVSVFRKKVSIMNGKKGPKITLKSNFGWPKVRFLNFWEVLHVFIYFVNFDRQQNLSESKRKKRRRDRAIWRTWSAAEAGTNRGF